MRGIEAVVAIVLLLIMTVGLVAIVWMIFGHTMRRSTSRTGQQIQNITTQQAQATQFTTAKSICEGQYVGGHFIENLTFAFNANVSLDVAGVTVYLCNSSDCPKNVNNKSVSFSCNGSECWGCVYRMGMEPDSPVAIAQWKGGKFNLIAMISAKPGNKVVAFKLNSAQNNKSQNNK